MNPLFESYKKMFLIRIAEEELVKLYLKHKIMSFVHFYIGQEAVAVGVCDALKKEDKVLGNHRSHGHYLAKGGDLKRMICELLSKENGLARGKGGSMHMIDRSVNFIGSTPILGSVVPIASGVAFEQKYNRRDGITVAFLGDGAFEEGIVYETLNLSALFKLPLLLVVENNLFSTNSKLKDRRSDAHHVEKIVTGFGVQYARADGNDFKDVSEKTHSLVEGVRTGRPAVLECVTYRHMAHSGPLFEEGYREEDILEKRQEEDSVKKMRQSILQSGVSEADVVSAENDIKKTVAEDIDFALNSPYPPKENLYTNVFA